MYAILSVDVESIWTAMPFYSIPITIPEKQDQEMFDRGIRNIIELLKKYNYNSTFFVMGKDAQRSSDSISYIADNGFEIANHSFSHSTAWKNLSYEKKKDEILKCEKIIQEVTSIKTIGFRAPFYQIDIETLNILSDLNYRYDSSLLPTFLPGITSPRYLLASSQPYHPNKNDELKRGDLRVLEIPTSTCLKLPLTGLLLKNFNILKYIKRFLKEPVVITIHSYDGSLDMFKDVKRLPWFLSHNHKKIMDILEKTLIMFKDMEFISFKEYLKLREH